jgi:EmrB/QacA subfamily drug resistance transporter
MPSTDPSLRPPPVRHRGAALAVLSLAAFTINVATSIAYVSLPTLTQEIGATSRDLLWIVDGFNLAFAALVLAAGSLSDRFGRKGALVTGLAVYVVASLLCAWSNSPGELILWRFVAGISAAIIFPTTLSIITNLYPDRRERAKAIGLWGAATGMAIALGPIAGGALLDSFWWGSAFVFCGGLGVVTLLLALGLVPTSRDPETPPLDAVGLVLSTVGLATLVYTIIEGSERGWASTATLGGFAGAAVVLAAFAFWERRRTHPMLDVRLFANLRFTAASGAVTFAYFALFGFVFLISQYFQFVLGYDVLEAGLRQVPVALSVATASILGTALAVRFGTKAVVVAGLLIFAGGFVWTSTVSADTGYTVIALQMLMIGSGLGLTSTPATEAIMGVVPAAKAGIGSAVNDATRELGGTLGVAVIGSIAVSIYRDRVAQDVPDGPVRELAQESLGAAAQAASRAKDPGLLSSAQDGFLAGLSTGCLVAAGVCIVGAVIVAVYLPSHPTADHDDGEADAADEGETDAAYANAAVAADAPDPTTDRPAPVAASTPRPEAVGTATRTTEVQGADGRLAWLPPLVTALVIGVAFVAIFVGLQRGPTPDRMPIATVGPDLTRTAERTFGSKADVVGVVDEQAGRQLVDDREVVGVVNALSDATLRFTYAGARGPSEVNAAQKLVAGLAKAQGARLQTVDAVPLVAEDSRGMTSFYVVFGVTLASFILAQALWSAAPRLPLRGRLAVTAGFAIVIGVLGALITGPIYGSLTAPFALLALTLVLLSAASAMTTTALVSWLGPAGIGLAVLLLTVVGNATGGATIGFDLLPSWAQIASDALPLGAATRAVNDLGYFDRSDVVPAFLILVAWIAVGLALVGAHQQRRARATGTRTTS